MSGNAVKIQLKPGVGAARLSSVAVVLTEATDVPAEVTVIGTRSNVACTDVERPVPVDVLIAKELQSTG